MSKPSVILVSDDAGLKSELFDLGITVSKTDSLSSVDGVLINDKNEDFTSLFELVFEKNLPLLVLGEAVFSLNEFLSGESIKETEVIEGKKFISPGSKLAMSIGGSGWVGITSLPKSILKLKQVSKKLAVSCFDESSMNVFGLESKGAHWVLAFSWCFDQLATLPKGFTNLTKSFAMRVKSSSRLQEAY